MPQNDESANVSKSYQIGNVGAFARVQQGANLTWTETSLVGLPGGSQLDEQFAALAHQILQAIADNCAPGASENVSDEQSSHSFSMVTRGKSALSSQLSALSFEGLGLFFAGLKGF